MSGTARGGGRAGQSDTIVIVIIAVHCFMVNTIGTSQTPIPSPAKVEAWCRHALCNAWLYTVSGDTWNSVCWGRMGW